MDWMKIANNALHICIFFSAAYAAVNPEWAWSIPAITATGQMLGTPNFKPAPKNGLEVKP